MMHCCWGCSRCCSCSPSTRNCPCATTNPKPPGHQFRRSPPPPMRPRRRPWTASPIVLLLLLLLLLLAFASLAPVAQAFAPPLVRLVRRSNRKNSLSPPPPPPRHRGGPLAGSRSDDESGTNNYKNSILVLCEIPETEEQQNNNTTNEFIVLDASGYNGDLVANLSIGTTTTNISLHPPRGGGGRLTTTRPEKPQPWTSVAVYWKTAFGSAVQTVVTGPLSRVGRGLAAVRRPFGTKSNNNDPEERIMEQLRTVVVQRVILSPNAANTTTTSSSSSSVLPPTVLQIAAQRSGVLGNPLRSEYVQDLAAHLHKWYQHQGYLLHSVTGATLVPETATAEIEVLEPVNHKEPIGISFYKEMVADPETGDLITVRKYKERLQQQQKLQAPLGVGQGRDGDDQSAAKIPSNVNTTFVPTKGWTKASRLATAMGMRPGQPFQWDHAQWQKIASSGLFSRILRTSPQPMGNGTVQMHIVVTEAPPRHLEYGMGKSLYSGGWEGELDFTHSNLFGGGEKMGVNVRRGTTATLPSVRLKFSNGRLGLEGGYDVEAFSEYIGQSSTAATDTASGASNSIKKKATIGSKRWLKFGKDPIIASVEASGNDHDSENAPMGIDPLFTETSSTNLEEGNDSGGEDDADVLWSRHGATFRVQNPIDSRTVRKSVASASLERTCTKAGFYETIGSTTIEVGPFLKELPLNARSNVDASFTTGARLGGGYEGGNGDPTGLFFKSGILLRQIKDNDDDGDDDDIDAGKQVAANNDSILPYISVSATTRQLFPLLPTSSSTTKSRTTGRPLLLALKHSVTASSDSVPKHVAMAIGNSYNLRGCSSNGPLGSILQGTAELRVPVRIPSPLRWFAQYKQKGPSSSISRDDSSVAVPATTNAVTRSSSKPINDDDDASLVVYGEWLVALRESSARSSSSLTSMVRKHSMGIGLRKNIQGFPLQYDVTYSNKGQLKCMFGLGSDFVF